MGHHHEKKRHIVSTTLTRRLQKHADGLTILGIEQPYWASNRTHAVFTSQNHSIVTLELLSFTKKINFESIIHVVHSEIPFI